MAIEPLLRKIKKEQIIGIGGLRSTVKMTAYADDLTLLVEDSVSLRRAMSLLEDFQKYSCLKVNGGKTEIIAIGNV